MYVYMYIKKLNISHSTVGVVDYLIVDGDTGVILVDVDQLRVVCRPGRTLVVN